MAEGGQPCTDLSNSKTKRLRQQSCKFEDNVGGTFTSIQNATNVQINGRMTVYMTSGSHSKKNIRPKKPLSKSTEKITKDQILNIKDRLGSDWKDLGRRLDFEEAELDQKQMQYKDDLKELNYQILHCWQQRKPQSATQANLAKIFITMSRGDLADLLAEESEHLAITN